MRRLKPSRGSPTPDAASSRSNSSSKRESYSSSGSLAASDPVAASVESGAGDAAIASDPVSGATPSSCETATGNGVEARTIGSVSEACTAQTQAMQIPRATRQIWHRSRARMRSPAGVGTGIGVEAGSPRPDPSTSGGSAGSLRLIGRRGQSIQHPQGGICLTIAERLRYAPSCLAKPLASTPPPAQSGNCPHLSSATTPCLWMEPT
jgi:hypothetical protein